MISYYQSVPVRVPALRPQVYHPDRPRPIADATAGREKDRAVNLHRGLVERTHTEQTSRGLNDSLRLYGGRGGSVDAHRIRLRSAKVAQKSERSDDDSELVVGLSTVRRFSVPRLVVPPLSRKSTDGPVVPP